MSYPSRGPISSSGTRPDHKAGFILAMPQAVGEMWNDGRYGPPIEDAEDVGFIEASSRTSAHGSRLTAVASI